MLALSLPKNGNPILDQIHPTLFFASLRFALGLCLHHLCVPRLLLRGISVVTLGLCALRLFSDSEKKKICVAPANFGRFRPLRVARSVRFLTAFDANLVVYLARGDLTQVSAQLSSEVEAQTTSWREKNEALAATVASLRVQVESLQAREFELRSALSDADREARALRVELRRAQGGTPLVTDVVLPNPIEKTIHGLERKVDRLKGNMISQTEELTKTSGDKSDLKARVRDLQLELDEAQKAKTKLELDKVDAERRLGRKIEDLEAKLATKAKEAKDRDLAVQKANRAKAHLEDKDGELSALKDQVEALKSELAHNRSKFDTVTEKQRTELSEERSKVEKLELKIHILQTELDEEKRKVAAAKSAQKQADESVRKLKLAQVEADKESDKLAARVARLEKNLRDMERATLRV